MAAVEETRLREEAVTLLQELIQANTVNPPGNEQAAQEFLKETLQDAGFECELLAEVPGRPGREAVRPMITLSTCATPEDHAAGNYWSDRFGNPEHRIDKIGVLVANRPA